MADATTSRSGAVGPRPGHEGTGRIADSVLDLVGNTPMLRLGKVVPADAAELLAKMESLNPAGSIKDRIALSMIEEAEAQGLLKPGDTIVEPTSGNTGIGLAMVAAVKGYRLILTMPEEMSVERRKLLSRYGADLVLTPAIEGMTGAVLAAQKLVEKHGYFMPQQFNNPANPEAHRRTTAQEILWATEGNLDAFVCGVGTGGTVTGVGEALKGLLPSLHVAAVEPQGSPILSGGRAGLHGIQGLGANFVPAVLNCDIYDELIVVSNEDAYAMTGRLTREEGLLVGISAGANVFAAVSVARRLGSGKRVVTILPDTGERYLSVNL